MAPNPSQVIDIDSDTSDDETPFITPQPLPYVVSSNPNWHLPSPLEQNTGSEGYEKCLKAILVVFPDISHDHVQQLWNRSARGALIGNDMQIQTLIERILDGGAYPKERDRLRELKKRKRASPEAEAAKWKYADLRHDPEEYAKVAKSHLMERFDLVPSRFINDTFKEHAHYYGTFFAVDEADRRIHDSDNPIFQRLKARRAMNPKPEQIMASLEAEGFDFEELKEEMRNTDARWQKEENNRKAEKERRLAKEASDEEYRRKGETIECACCFDCVPPTDTTHCDADKPHFFCFCCAKQNAECDMVSLKYTLRCMDQSRCEATFSRQQRARFLDTAIIDKLERLQQQDEIRRAEMGDLEACPFCEYVAICLPPDVNRIFECQNPDCMETSCRLCKQKSHIPLSCEEFKKENGIGERHAIEEARTEALIRSCRKCKVRILKEDGCNKVVCTNCYSTICDYCGEDISKSRYEHFNSELRELPTGKRKCPLYDASNRKEDQIEKAGQAAMEKIRQENSSLSEEDLKIKFAKVIQDQSRRHREIPDMHFRHAEPMHPGRRQHLPAELLVPLPPDPRRQLLQIQQQQLQNLQMFQAQIQLRMSGQMQRMEADRGDRQLELGGAEPQYRQGPHNEHGLMGHGGAAGFIPHQQALGHLAHGAGIQPPGMPRMAAPPFNPFPTRNWPTLGAMDPTAGWQHHHPSLGVGSPPRWLNAPFQHQNYFTTYQQPEQGQVRHQQHARELGAPDVNFPAPHPYPAPQPVLQRAQAFNDIGTEFGVRNKPRPSAYATVGPHLQGGALTPHFDYNPRGNELPVWPRNPTNTPFNGGVDAGIGTDELAPDLINNTGFDAFVVDSQQNGNGRQGLLRAPHDQGVQRGQQHLE